MKTFLVTGYSSTIARDLLVRIRRHHHDVRVVKCGRGPDADLIVDLSDLQSVRQWLNGLPKLRPRYIFLNHGLLPGKRVNTLSDAMIADSLHVNLVSTLMALETISGLPHV